jgi:hypothetical protein
MKRLIKALLLILIISGSIYSKIFLSFPFTTNNIKRKLNITIGNNHSSHAIIVKDSNRIRVTKIYKPENDKLKIWDESSFDAIDVEDVMIITFADEVLAHNVSGTIDYNFEKDVEDEVIVTKYNQWWGKIPDRNNVNLEVEGTDGISVNKDGTLTYKKATVSTRRKYKNY